MSTERVLLRSARPRVLVTRAVLRMYNPEIIRFLDQTLETFADPARYEQLCTRRLEAMLHWCRRIPLYRERFAAAGVLQGDRVRPERLSDVAPLTKADIRNQFQALQHPDPQRGRHENTSGGSTGEPVRFIQDRRYQARAVADTILFGVVNGKQPGDPEVKLWGSERDILEGTIGVREQLINRVFNRVLLNSFSLDAATMRAHCAVINRVRPVQVWTYVESIIELARFAAAAGIALFNPRVIVCTAGTLYPEMRAELQAAFPHSRIVNQYGSREVGQLATEAVGVTGLWIMRHSNHVELVDAQSGLPVTEPGRSGRVLVTTLNNYSMPLVRYDIGDIAEFAPRAPHSHLSFQRVSGRENTHFITGTGARVHGEYFTHLFYGQRWLETFQVVQTGTQRVAVRYVPSRAPGPTAAELHAIEEKIRRVMGSTTEVSFEPQTRIARLASGKFQFVKREFA